MGNPRAVRHAAAIAVAVLLASPAAARVEFSAYEGPDAIQTGQGGTKIQAHGIDYWTSGSPPRRFEILGLLTDSRRNNIFTPRAIGSEGLARRVLELGGNALIVMDQQRIDRGFAGGLYSSEGFTGFNARRRTSTATSFVVIRYLD